MTPSLLLLLLAQATGVDAPPEASARYRFG